jgi:hypothetical protein
VQAAVAVVSMRATHQELAAQAVGQAVELVVILAHWSYQSMQLLIQVVAVVEMITLILEQVADQV